jgi:hypothetical protein
MKPCLGGTRHFFGIVEAGLGVTIPKFVPDRNQTPVFGCATATPTTGLSHVVAQLLLNKISTDILYKDLRDDVCRRR